MSAAPHLRLINTETGEAHEARCPHCAESEAETEIWEQRVLKLERQVKSLTEDRDAKLFRDRDYPAAETLFDEWRTECGHPNAKFDTARIAIALKTVKRYKNEREKLSLVVQHGKHLAYVDPKTGHKKDSFGLLFRDAEQIENRATSYYLWHKRTGGTP